MPNHLLKMQYKGKHPAGTSSRHPVAGQDLLVDLDAEPRSLGHADAALLQPDRVPAQLAEHRAAGDVQLQKEGSLQVGVQVQGGGGQEIGEPGMGTDRDVPQIREVSDLASDGEAAAAREVRL